MPNLNLANTLPQLAARLKRDPSTVWRQMKRLGIEPVTVGKTVVLTDEQAAMIEAYQVKPGRVPGNGKRVSVEVESGFDALVRGARE